MASEQNDATSYQRSNPTLCTNNCGFFGNQSTMNLCSKCYRDFCLKEEQAASAIAAMEKSLNPKSVKTLENTENTPVIAVVESSSAAMVSAVKKAANRCEICNKKVGITGFVCRCGNTFCGGHRYPEKHDCSFDFKGVGRDGIAKANPVIKADKIDRI